MAGIGLKQGDLWQVLVFDEHLFDKISHLFDKNSLS